jgi:SAM-dependent methyltransferase
LNETRLPVTTDAQRWDPDAYATHARFVSDLGQPVVDLLAPRSGERILDLGCGDGVLTRRLHDAGAQVIGVDSSPEMVAAACLLGLDARVMDATALPFEREFDAVFSNAALHWIPDAAAVIAGVARALKPGGRFVGEFGGAGNVAEMVAALNAARARRALPPRHPWFNPTAEAYGALLRAGGLDPVHVELFHRPTPLPGHVADWLRTFGHLFIADIPADGHAAVIAEAVEHLRPSRCREGRWSVDYVRLRFAARLPPRP